MLTDTDMIFQRYYTVAKRCETQEQAARWMVDYLRSRLNAPCLDIRRRKINGRLHWCVVRWSHPREVFGLFAKHGHGLTHLPVTILHFTACEVCGSRPDSRDHCPNQKCSNYLGDCHAPRDFGITDLESLTKSPRDYVQKVNAAYGREQAAFKRMSENFGADFAAEINPHFKSRSFGTGWMVEENERRIAAGET